MGNLPPKVEYTLWGILFGLCFPLGATVVDIVVQGAGLNFSSIFRVQAQQPLHWIIDTAPFILGLLAHFIGRSQHRIVELNEALEERLDLRTMELEAANKDLTATIAEQHQTQESLRRSEDKLGKIASAAQDAIVMMDAEGKVSFWNPAAERIFGYSREAITGQLLHAVLTPARYRAAQDAGFARFRETGQGAAVDQTTELVGLRQDGTEFPVELSLSAVRIDDQWHAVGILRDITERKKAEAELHDAREAAEEADRAKSRFLANMSHEIRTPMNAIIGFADLLGSTELTPTQQEYIKTVQNSSNALLGLINDILDFSKIEAGRLEMEEEPFHLRDVLDEIADMFRGKVAESNVEIIIDVDQDVPPGLVGDALRLRQVLVNLVGNAVKFTKQGEVVLSVKRESATDAKATLSFAVRDTGIGISREEIGKLFSAFTQADGSTTRKFGGTGLGLAVCKQLVELMGGEIGVESRPGNGSVFHFTATFGRTDAKIAAVEDLAGKLGALRVLIVDDNESNRTVMQHMVESFAWHAQAVSSGSEALAALQAASSSNAFDLVLIDWRMPGMDGMETCARIRADAKLSHTRIVMMTAFGRGAEKEQAARLKLDAFLIKPIKPSLLLETVASIWGLRRKPAVESAGMITNETRAKPFAGHRVLLAEDNPINQKLAVILLEREGFSVDTAENGRLAVEAVQRGSYDAVLMDVQMPEMDGYDATRAIRAIPRFRDLPIIAMTASVMQGDKDKCLEAGMNDYASKPIDPPQLFATLRRWVMPHSDAAGSPRDVATTRPEKGIAVSQLPGIDFADALARVGGDEDLLREVLSDFAEETTRMVPDIREALTKDDSVLARRLAHTLKGIAANLPARRLHEAAGALEDAISNGEEQLDGLIESVDVTLTQVREGIRAPD